MQNYNNNLKNEKIRIILKKKEILRLLQEETYIMADKAMKMLQNK